MYLDVKFNASVELSTTILKRARFRDYLNCLFSSILLWVVTVLLPDNPVCSVVCVLYIQQNYPTWEQ